MTTQRPDITGSLQWCHNGRDGVSNHQRLDCLLNCLFRHTSKKTSELRATGLCDGNSPGTNELPAQKASNAKMSPFDDVMMLLVSLQHEQRRNSFLALDLSNCSIACRWYDISKFASYNVDIDFILGSAVQQWETPGKFHNDWRTILNKNITIGRDFISSYGTRKRERD